MLFFLRKIRRKLLQKNRFTTYLLYALGEILLVVIGILIAVSLNNWNQSRKQLIQEAYIIEELRKEVAANIELLQFDIQYNIHSLNAAIEMIALVQSEKLIEERAKADSLLVGVYSVSGFDAITGFIDDVISTGKLEIIRNDTLRYLLSNWEYQLQDYKDDYGIRNTLIFEQFVPFLQKNYPVVDIIPIYETIGNHGDYSKLKASTHAPNLEKLYSLEFEGFLTNHIINQEYLLDESENYIYYLESILHQLNEEEDGP